MLLSHKDLQGRPGKPGLNVCSGLFDAVSQGIGDSPEVEDLWGIDTGLRCCVSLGVGFGLGFLKQLQHQVSFSSLKD